MLEGITKGPGESVLAAILNSASVRAPGTRGSPIAIPSESWTSGEETDSAPINVSCQAKRSYSDSDVSGTSGVTNASSDDGQDVGDVGVVGAAQPEEGLEGLKCVLSGPTFEWMKDLLATKLSSETVFEVRP